MQPDLVIICGIAFAAVIVVLATLGVCIRVLTSLFPDDSPDGDPALMKAIGNAVGQTFPGATVVSVEVVKKN